MSDDTKIEWTDATWNPVTGCSKVSEGCRHCYAEAVAERFWTGRKFTEVRCHEERLSQPVRWKRGRRVFVNSMSDLFHADVPTAFIDRVFEVMACCQHHTFQILTKRPERMRAYCSRSPRFPMPTDRLPFTMLADSAGSREQVPTGPRWLQFADWPLPNVWLGVSVEDQATADDRIPQLLDTPAAVRFISAEPLLGALNVQRWLHDSNCEYAKTWDGLIECSCFPPRERCIDWVITGGESGPHARPMDVDWVRSLRAQCMNAPATAFFFKQWGGVHKRNTGRVLDGRTWDEMPGGA